jgi:hypothetical protein
MHDLSDEALCARWLENPYYQFFCGELSFCHQLPFDRSSMTHWRQRLGEEQLVALLQESKRQPITAACFWLGLIGGSWRCGRAGL